MSQEIKHQVNDTISSCKPRSFNFSVLHVNVQSLLNKIDELHLALDDNSFDILCVSEHWLNYENLKMINLPNYCLVSSFCREGRNRHGGVAIFTSANCILKSIDVTKFAISIHAELCAAEIKCYNCLLLAVYRSSTSGDLSVFKDCIYRVVDFFSRKYKFLILTGDLNLDLGANTEYVNDLKNIFLMYGMKHCINVPTRITPNSKSSLDNIITNITPATINTGILDLSIADHMGVFICVECSISHEFKSKDSVDKRCINNSKTVTFLDTLKPINWLKLFEPNLNSNDLTKNFVGTFTQIVNNCFPFVATPKKVAVKWFNRELKEMRRNLYKSKKRFRDTNSDSDWSHYCGLRKLYRKAIKVTKRNTYTKIICDSDNKSKTVWNIVNSERPHKNGSTKSDITANDFNKFFSSISDSIIKSIDCHNIDPLMLLYNHPKPTSSFFMSSILETDVRQAILHLKNSTCLDYYGLNSRIIKISLEFLVAPLTVLFNKLIEEGLWPDCFKITKVFPIHKKGGNDVLDNFRPISIVPIFSKIFEILLKEKILSYLENKSILSPVQFGFRKNFSTIKAILAVIDEVVEGLDNRLWTHANLCDLTKAFDCVNTDILLTKLEYYGFRNNILNLFRSYLTNRQQYVSIDDIESSLLPSLSGVPQGSVLGPVLFLIYINDFPKNIQNSKCILFADDTTLLTRGCEDSSIRSLNEASTWFSANKLKLNVSKTQNIIFSSNKSHSKSNVVKLLGITLDPGLNWMAHIDCLCSKLSSQIFVMRQLRPSLDNNTMRIVYFSLIHSRLSYGITLWGNSSTVNRVFLLQKAAVRLVADVSNAHSCRNIFKKYNILPLPCLYILEALYLVHKNLPNLQRHSDIHQLNTRHADNLIVPFSRINITKNNKQQISLYNKFISHFQQERIKQMSNKSFHIFTKKFLLQHIFYSINDFISFV